MFVAVTGAGGFVGRHMVRALLDAGCTVIASDTHFDPDLRREWAGIEGHRLRMVEAAVSELPPVALDALVHAAALTASPEEAGHSPVANLRANLDPFFDAVEWAQQNGARRTIAISSSAVFRQSAPGPLHDDQPPQPLGTYAVAKTAIEYTAETLRQCHGLDILAVRLGSIYGPGEAMRASRPRVSQVRAMIDEALQTGTITVTRPDDRRDWTFAPDVGRAIVSLVQAERLNHALYNVSSGETLTDWQLAQAIRAHLPHTEITMQAEPGALNVRAGTLVSDRLHQDTGFADWTNFVDGVGHMIAAHTRLDMPS